VVDIELQVLANRLLNAASVSALVFEHEVKRWLAISCDLVSHMVHASMAGRFFFCKLSAIYNLLSKSNHMNNLILRGVGMRQMRCKVGFGIPGSLRNLYADLIVNCPVGVRFQMSAPWLSLAEVAFIIGCRLFISCIKNDVVVVVVVCEVEVVHRGKEWPSVWSMDGHSESSLLPAIQSHLSSRALFWVFMSITPNPPNRLGRVTRFHGTMQ
jgi:hypothetical protein